MFEPTDAPSFHDAGDRRRRRGAQRARQADRPALSEEQPRAERHQHQATSGTRSCRTSTRRCNYITTGVGGTLLSPVDLTQPATRRRARSSRQRGFGSVLGDVFQSAYPNWTVGVQVGYPLGSSTAQANLARAKLQYEQAQAQMKNLRDAGRRAGARRRAQRADQPEAGAVGARVARAAGEEARGGGEEARGRHVVDLLRLPGAARSRRSPARPRSRRSPTTTSRSWTSKPCSRCRSAAASAASRPPATARCRPAGSFGQEGTRRAFTVASRTFPFRLLASTLPRVPKLSVTVITKNEAADIGAALDVGRLGRRDRRRRLAQHGRHGRDRATVHRSRRRPRLARLHRAEELRGVAREPRLDSVARRRRARDAGARGGDPATAAGEPARMRRSAFRA